MEEAGSAAAAAEVSSMEIPASAISAQTVPPPAPSPLSGGYLLIVIGEPHCEEHKQLILQRLAKGFLSWDAETCHVDLEKELLNLASQAPEGEESRNGERLIQFASESLVTEVLVQPQTSTLLQCTRNLLSSFTRHRHIIHAGYTFAANGSWALQDGTYSIADFLDSLQETEAQRVIRAYENSVSIDIHCSSEGDWNTERMKKELCTKGCQLRVNPDDRLTAGSTGVSSFVEYISTFIAPASLESLLEPSDVVGNIRFSHPTLYVFPGGQGDAALFGINGFNMLVDGGFSRKSCFWDFTRHLDRLDAVMVTRLNNSNINGISSVLKRKRLGHVYPQIGHFFCNLTERKSLMSPDGDKDRDELLIDLLDEGQDIVTNLRHLELKPHACYRDLIIEPINLYHKVGHGKLDMYVLSPAKDSKEVKDFLTKWNTSDQKLFAQKSSKGEIKFPLQNLTSICALLVWQPANPMDTITRILFPGSTPQHKIFEGLEKLKHLEFLKHPVCTARSLHPINTKSKAKILEKLSVEPKVTKASSIIETKPVAPEVKTTKSSGVIEKSPKVMSQTVSQTSTTKTDRNVRATRGVEKSQDAVEKLKNDKNKHEPKDLKKKVDQLTKQDAKSTAPKQKLVHKSLPDRKVQRAASTEKKSEKLSSPTQKKQLELKSKPDMKPAAPKPKMKVSPAATPAKSAKDANNRKVIESKIQSSRASSTKVSAKKIPDVSTQPLKKQAVKKIKPASPSKHISKTISAVKNLAKSELAEVKQSSEVDEGKIEVSVVSTTDTAIESNQKSPDATVQDLPETLLDTSEIIIDKMEEHLEDGDDKAEENTDNVVGDVEELDRTAVLSSPVASEDIIDDDARETEADHLDCKLQDDADDTKESLSMMDSQLEEETEEDVELDKKLLDTDDRLSDTDIDAKETDVEEEEELKTDDAEDKHVRDEEESEKERKSKDLEDIGFEEIEQENVAIEAQQENLNIQSQGHSPDSIENKIASDVVKVSTEIDEFTQGEEGIDEDVQGKLSDETKEAIEHEVKDIICSAQSAIATQEETKQPEHQDCEAKSVESDEKLDLSSEKVKEDITPDEDKKNQKLDDGTNTKSQPEEKVSAMETSATTAPSMPEDERIPLDEIKEIVEEKYIKEETKEKETDRYENDANKIPSIPSLPQVITSIPFDHQSHALAQRDIVKTPDEVADLPMHEEVDATPFEHDVSKSDRQQSENNLEKDTMEIGQDVEMATDVKEKAEVVTRPCKDMTPETEILPLDDKLEQITVVETQEKDHPDNTNIENTLHVEGKIMQRNVDENDLEEDHLLLIDDKLTGKVECIEHKESDDKENIDEPTLGELQEDQKDETSKHQTDEREETNKDLKVEGQSGVRKSQGIESKCDNESVDEKILFESSHIENETEGDERKSKDISFDNENIKTEILEHEDDLGNLASSKDTEQIGEDERPADSTNTDASGTEIKTDVISDSTLPSTANIVEHKLPLTASEIKQTEGEEEKIVDNMSKNLDETDISEKLISSVFIEKSMSGLKDNNEEHEAVAAETDTKLTDEDDNDVLKDKVNTDFNEVNDEQHEKKGIQNNVIQDLEDIRTKTIANVSVPSEQDEDDKKCIFPMETDDCNVTAAEISVRELVNTPSKPNIKDQESDNSENDMQQTDGYKDKIITDDTGKDLEELNGKCNIENTQIIGEFEESSSNATKIIEKENINVSENEIKQVDADVNDILEVETVNRLEEICITSTVTGSEIFGGSTTVPDGQNMARKTPSPIIETKEIDLQTKDELTETISKDINEALSTIDKPTIINDATTSLTDDVTDLADEDLKNLNNYSEEDNKSKSEDLNMQDEAKHNEDVQSMSLVDKVAQNSVLSTLTTDLIEQIQKETVESENTADDVKKAEPLSSSEEKSAIKDDVKDDDYDNKVEDNVPEAEYNANEKNTIKFDTDKLSSPIVDTSINICTINKEEICLPDISSAQSENAMSFETDKLSLNGLQQDESTTETVLHKQISSENKKSIEQQETNIKLAEVEQEVMPMQLDLKSFGDNETCLPVTETISCETVSQTDRKPAVVDKTPNEETNDITEIESSKTQETVLSLGDGKIDMEETNEVLDNDSLKSKKDYIEDSNTQLQTSDEKLCIDKIDISASTHEEVCDIETSDHLPEKVETENKFDEQVQMSKHSTEALNVTFSASKENLVDEYVDATLQLQTCPVAMQSKEILSTDKIEDSNILETVSALHVGDPLIVTANDTDQYTAIEENNSQCNSPDVGLEKDKDFDDTVPPKLESNLSVSLEGVTDSKLTNQVKIEPDSPQFSEPINIVTQKLYTKFSSDIESADKEPDEVSNNLISDPLQQHETVADFSNLSSTIAKSCQQEQSVIGTANIPDRVKTLEGSAGKYHESSIPDAEEIVEKLIDMDKVNTSQEEEIRSSSNEIDYKVNKISIAAGEDSEQLESLSEKQLHVEAEPPETNTFPASDEIIQGNDNEYEHSADIKSPESQEEYSLLKKANAMQLENDSLKEDVLVETTPSHDKSTIFDQTVHSIQSEAALNVIEEKIEMPLTFNMSEIDKSAPELLNSVGINSEESNVLPLASEEKTESDQNECLNVDSHSKSVDKGDDNNISQTDNTDVIAESPSISKDNQSKSEIELERKTPELEIKPDLQARMELEYEIKTDVIDLNKVEVTNNEKEICESLSSDHVSDIVKEELESKTDVALIESNVTIIETDHKELWQSRSNESIGDNVNKELDNKIEVSAVDTHIEEVLADGKEITVSPSTSSINDTINKGIEMQTDVAVDESNTTKVEIDVLDSSSSPLTGSTEDNVNEVLETKIDVAIVDLNVTKLETDEKKISPSSSTGSIGDSVKEKIENISEVVAVTTNITEMEGVEPKIALSSSTSIIGDIVQSDFKNETDVLSVESNITKVETDEKKIAPSSLTCSIADTVKEEFDNKTEVAMGVSRITKLEVDENQVSPSPSSGSIGDTVKEEFEKKIEISVADSKITSVEINVNEISPSPSTSSIGKKNVIENDETDVIEHTKIDTDTREIFQSDSKGIIENTIKESSANNDDGEITLSSPVDSLNDLQFLKSVDKKVKNLDSSMDDGNTAQLNESIEAEQKGNLESSDEKHLTNQIQHHEEEEKLMKTISNVESEAVNILSFEEPKIIADEDDFTSEKCLNKCELDLVSESVEVKTNESKIDISQSSVIASDSDKPVINDQSLDKAMLQSTEDVKDVNEESLHLSHESSSTTSTVQEIIKRSSDANESDSHHIDTIIANDKQVLESDGNEVKVEKNTVIKQESAINTNIVEDGHENLNALTKEVSQEKNETSFEIHTNEDVTVQSKIENVPVEEKYLNLTFKGEHEVMTDSELTDNTSHEINTCEVHYDNSPSPTNLASTTLSTTNVKSNLDMVVDEPLIKSINNQVVVESTVADEILEHTKVVADLQDIIADVESQIITSESNFNLTPKITEDLAVGCVMNEVSNATEICNEQASSKISSSGLDEVCELPCIKAEAIKKNNITPESAKSTEYPISLDTSIKNEIEESEVIDESNVSYEEIVGKDSNIVENIIGSQTLNNLQSEMASGTYSAIQDDVLSSNQETERYSEVQSDDIHLRDFSNSIGTEASEADKIVIDEADMQNTLLAESSEADGNKNEEFLCLDDRSTSVNVAIPISDDGLLKFEEKSDVKQNDCAMSNTSCDMKMPSLSTFEKENISQEQSVNDAIEHMHMEGFNIEKSQNTVPTEIVTGDHKLEPDLKNENSRSEQLESEPPQFEKSLDTTGKEIIEEYKLSGSTYSSMKSYTEVHAEGTVTQTHFTSGDARNIDCGSSTEGEGKLEIISSQADPLTASYLEIIEKLQEQSNEEDKTADAKVVSDNLAESISGDTQNQDNSESVSRTLPNEIAELSQCSSSEDIDDRYSKRHDAINVRHRLMLTASSEDGGDEMELASGVIKEKSPSPVEVSASVDSTSGGINNIESSIVKTYNISNVPEEGSFKASSSEYVAASKQIINSSVTESTAKPSNDVCTSSIVTEKVKDEILCAKEMVDDSLENCKTGFTSTFSTVSTIIKESDTETGKQASSTNTVLRGPTPTSDGEHEMAPSTPHSDISSGQMSRAPNQWDEQRPDSRHSDLSDKEPFSPQTTASQSFTYQAKEMSAMTSSFYGSLPEDEDTETQSTKVSQGVRTEQSRPFHYDDDSYKEEEEDAYHGFHGQPRHGTGEQTFCTNVESMHREINNGNIYELPANNENGNETGAASRSFEDFMNSNKFIPTSSDNTRVEFQTPGQSYSFESPTRSVDGKDPIESWGKPLGLPSPAPPNNNSSNDAQTNGRGTPKKENKQVLNKKSNDKVKDGKVTKESSAKQKILSCPMYFDLAYVPHHGNSHYTQTEFFKKIRARYYVFSGLDPSREVYSSLLEAKQTWEDRELEVTIIPTYDTDTLGYWVAENEDALAQHKIDLSPSASRCTINLQDHETSCSAYRLEF